MRRGYKVRGLAASPFQEVESGTPYYPGHTHPTGAAAAATHLGRGQTSACCSRILDAVSPCGGGCGTLDLRGGG